MSDSVAPVAIITGGSAGLGRVVAERFLSDGYHVWIVGRDQTKLDAVIKQVSNERINSISADLSSPALRLPK